MFRDGKKAILTRLLYIYLQLNQCFYGFYVGVAVSMVENFFYVPSVGTHGKHEKQIIECIEYFHHVNLSNLANYFEMFKSCCAYVHAHKYAAYAQTLIHSHAHTLTSDTNTSSNMYARIRAACN